MRYPVLLPSVIPGIVLGSLTFARTQAACTIFMRALPSEQAMCTVSSKLVVEPPVTVDTAGGEAAEVAEGESGKVDGVLVATHALVNNFCSGGGGSVLDGDVLSTVAVC